MMATKIRILVLVILGLSGCATQGDAAKHKPDSVLSNSQTEPVYSTSVAIRLAELTLKQMGIDSKERAVAVSYCDGMYTVTFRRPPEMVMAKDFVIDIDADTSRIIRVEAGQ